MKLSYPCSIIIVAAALLLPGCASAPEQATTVSTPASFTGTYVDISKVDVVPRAIKQLAPKYPVGLRKRNISGKTVIAVIVDTDGNIREAKALSASQQEFADAAIECVKTWKFHSAMKNGKPVRCIFSIPLSFDINSE